ncbi:hypothetical protein CR650_21925 [Salmonella enterica]|nr:hypothetical protein [Salmonella enterica]
MTEAETQDQDFLDRYKEPNFQALLGELDGAVVIRFFHYFSRFEYALKRRDFKKVSGRFIIGADWPGYVSTLDSIHYPTESIKVKNAIELLCNSPVKRQLKNLSWQANRPINSLSFKRALKQVPYIRNNLFHGGKYMNSNATRDLQLLESAIYLMQYCLVNDPELFDYFHRPDM